MDTADYRRVEGAIRFLEEHAAEQPSLEAVAAYVGLSSYHFQRLFRRWAGVSPKRFLQHLTVQAAKRHLRDSASVLGATFATGLSRPSRLHDLFVAVEAVTPGQFKQHGAGLVLRHGVHPTPFGPCLLALSERGICALWFVEASGAGAAVEALRREWQGARLAEDRDATREIVARIFDRPWRAEEGRLPLFLRGTNFQLKVWRALLQIPDGAVVSYGTLAGQLGVPAAARAVGNAVGKNPIAYLIPCHRVLRGSGEVGGYRWDALRKKALLARELAAADAV